MVLAVTVADVFDLALSVVIGVLYGAVAWTVASRPVSSAARTANLSFATWWWGLAALTFFGAVWTIIHWFVPPNLPLWMAYVTFLLLLVMLAFAALLYYFLYLWSGRESLWVPVSIFYLLLFVFFIFYIQLQQPTGFDAAGEVVYANDLSESVLGTVIGVLWLVPTIVGAALYLGLVRKVQDRLLRFRIIVVAGSIIVWFLITISSSLADTSQADWWTYVSRGISATVATLTLIAYRPPAPVRRWFNLEESVPPSQDTGQEPSESVPVPERPDLE